MYAFSSEFWALRAYWRSNKWQCILSYPFSSCDRSEWHCWCFKIGLVKIELHTLHWFQSLLLRHDGSLTLLTRPWLLKTCHNSWIYLLHLVLQSDFHLIFQFLNSFLQFIDSHSLILLWISPLFQFFHRLLKVKNLYVLLVVDMLYDLVQLYLYLVKRSPHLAIEFVSSIRDFIQLFPMLLQSCINLIRLKSNRYLGQLAH